MSAYLVASGLEVNFGGLRALQDCSFTVERGRITCLVGPNGAGKTTIFNVITGFLRPDAGGKDIFFHVSRLQDGDATELTPGKRISYELGMDRNGKIAASSVRFLPTEEPPKAD